MHGQLSPSTHPACGGGRGRRPRACGPQALLDEHARARPPQAPRQRPRDPAAPCARRAAPPPQPGAAAAVSACAKGLGAWPPRAGGQAGACAEGCAPASEARRSGAREAGTVTELSVAEAEARREACTVSGVAPGDVEPFRERWALAARAAAQPALRCGLLASKRGRARAANQALQPGWSLPAGPSMLGPSIAFVLAHQRDREH